MQSSTISVTSAWVVVEGWQTGMIFIPLLRWSVLTTVRTIGSLQNGQFTNFLARTWVLQQGQVPIASWAGKVWPDVQVEKEQSRVEGGGLEGNGVSAGVGGEVFTKVGDEVFEFGDAAF